MLQWNITTLRVHLNETSKKMCTKYLILGEDVIGEVDQAPKLKKNKL